MTISGLPTGNHVGFIVGFDPLDQVREQRVAELLSQAVSAGNTLSRVQLDWAELEPSPGVFDATALRDALDGVDSIGLFPFVLVTTLDSGVLTLPSDLMSQGQLRAGLTLADPIVEERFENFLNWLLPELLEAGVWGVSIANEGETLIEDGIVTSDDASLFVERGLRHIAMEAPALARGVTLTSTGPAKFSAYATAVLSNSNLAVYNFYCLGEDLTTTDRSVWQAVVEELKDASGELPIMFQELGCPVGYEDRTGSIDGVPERQTEFFGYFAELIQSDPQIRALYAFQLLDWSPELAASFVQPIRDAGSILAADRTEEWLATSGLCSWLEDRCRPGWDAWLALTNDARDTQ